MPETSLSPHTGLPLQFTSAFAAVHAPIPVDQRTHEGRYVWEPRLHFFTHPAPGLSGNAASPSLSDLSFLAQRRQMPNGQVESPLDAHYRLSPYVDQMYSTFPTTSPVSVRGLSPVDTRGIPLHADYLQQMAALSQRCVVGDFHATHQPGAVGGDVPFSVDGSRHASPRPGPRHGRKRALSSSPYSDSFDINSMIRFSPNSLVSFMNGSRSSSASGSYGHLSAGTLSPALGVPPPPVPPHFQQLHHLMRQGGLSSPILLPPTTGLSQQSLLPGHMQMGLGASMNMAKLDTVVDPSNGRETASNIVSSTVDTEEAQRSMVKKEAASSTGGDFAADDDRDGAADLKDEPGDFIETNCHWKDCCQEFGTQEELVKHINNDHIHGNKKSFVCRWRDCARDEKPFKAQYMLVVHMRRHTGEKPHRCTFEGCTKAYSRLENLKTHLRSHTGEKPYMCEFPGCTKAFSNASDRAKHQNRTHSNEKPYVCKAPGCTKRYTDPSSLRKHVKTVHGPEFYANKKHKGGDGAGGGTDGQREEKTFDQASSENSPTSEEGSASKAGSMSSPSIKSEESPDHSGSPGEELGSGDQPGTTEQEAPISDNSISTTSGPLEADAGWDLTENTLAEVEEASPVMCAVSSTGHREEAERNTRNRLKSRLHAQLKSVGSWLPNLFPSRGGTGNNSTSNGSRLRGGAPKFPEISQEGRNAQQRNMIDLSFPQPAGCPTRHTSLGVQCSGGRRGSSSSTVSSFYSSMYSETSSQPLSSRISSRRGSGVSRSVEGLNSPCDPISLGSSRRSSEISGYTGLPPGVTAHLHRLHSHALASQQNSTNKNIITQNQSSCVPHDDDRQTSLSASTPLPHEVPNMCTRRASDPLRPVEKPGRMGRELQKHNSFNSFTRLPPLPPICSTQGSRQDTSPGQSQHPNEAVILDELEEDRPIEENKDLVLPDDMVHYLNQVAEKARCETGQHSNRPPSQISHSIMSSVSQYGEPQVSNGQICYSQGQQPYQCGNYAQTCNQMQPPSHPPNIYNTMQQQCNRQTFPSKQIYPIQQQQQQQQQYCNNHQPRFIPNCYPGHTNQEQHPLQQPPSNPQWQQQENIISHDQRQTQGMNIHCNQQYPLAAGQGNFGTESCSLPGQTMPMYTDVPYNGNMNQKQIYPSQQVSSCPPPPSPYHYNSQGQQMQPAGQQHFLTPANNNMQPSNTTQNCNQPLGIRSHSVNVPNQYNSDGNTQAHYYNANSVNSEHSAQISNHSQHYCSQNMNCHMQSENMPGQFYNQRSGIQQLPMQNPYCGQTPGNTMPPPNGQNQCCHHEKTVQQYGQNSKPLSPPHCNNCTNQKPEIQCQNVSQSSLSSMQPEAYQRTLEYVQQCQQLMGDKSQVTGDIANFIGPLPGCQQNEMSPGSNKVTSSTDKKRQSRQTSERANTPFQSAIPNPFLQNEARFPFHGNENKPPPESPLLTTNNMVINDMNSTLTSLVEETRYLQMLQ